MKKQHLTIFLLKGNREFKGVVKNEVQSKSFGINNQSFQGRLYLPEQEETTPSWYQFLKSGFPKLPAFKNKQVSALLLIRTSMGMYAMAFGQGRHLLKPDVYERDFGLRVAANTVCVDRIRGVNIRMLKENTIKLHQEAARGTELQAFGIDAQQDLLRGIVGVPEDSTIGSRLHGSDSLAVYVDLNFKDIGTKCDQLLNSYKSDKYKKRGFEWIDNLRIVRNPDILMALNVNLLEAIRSRDKSVQLLCPDSFEFSRIHGFLYRGEHHNAEKHSTLNIDEWYDLIDSSIVLDADKLNDCRIRVYDDTDVKICDLRIFDCFVFETTIKTTKYILSNGEWFEVANSFNSTINKYIEKIQGKLSYLPNCQRCWSDEDAYIAAASANSDLLSMHKKNYTIEGNQVEPCDMLHKDGKLIHVKMWSQSSTFSHLLGQGAISAESLIQYAGFRQHLALSSKALAKIPKLFPKDNFVPSKISVVFALVREQLKPLPFFSRLNLMRNGQRIEKLGFKVVFNPINII